MIGYYKALNGACFVLPEAQGSFTNPILLFFLSGLRLFRPVTNSACSFIPIPFSEHSVAPRHGPPMSDSFVFPT